MAGVESARAFAWAEQVLAADTTFMAACPGGIHLGVAPQGNTAVVCTLWMPSEVDYVSFKQSRIWADSTLMVKITGPMPITNIVAAADRADVLLNGQSGAAQGKNILASTRISGFVIPEKGLVNGVQWVSIVQSFRTLVQ